MTRTYTLPNGTRRISKIGIGEAEYMYQGAELISERDGLFATLYIRHNGETITLSSSSKKDIAAIKRSFGF